jgi:hypothetical protein
MLLGCLPSLSLRFQRFLSGDRCSFLVQFLCIPISSVVSVPPPSVLALHGQFNLVIIIFFWAHPCIGAGALPASGPGLPCFIIIFALHAFS